MARGFFLAFNIFIDRIPHRCGDVSDTSVYQHGTIPHTSGDDPEKFDMVLINPLFPHMRGDGSLADKIKCHILIYSPHQWGWTAQNVVLRIN